MERLESAYLLDPSDENDALLISKLTEVDPTTASMAHLSLRTGLRKSEMLGASLVRPRPFSRFHALHITRSGVSHRIDLGGALNDFALALSIGYKPPDGKLFRYFSETKFKAAFAHAAEAFPGVSFNDLRIRFAHRCLEALKATSAIMAA